MRSTTHATAYATMSASTKTTNARVIPFGIPMSSR